MIFCCCFKIKLFTGISNCAVKSCATLLTAASCLEHGSPLSSTWKLDVQKQQLEWEETSQVCQWVTPMLLLLHINVNGSAKYMQWIIRSTEFYCLDVGKHKFKFWTAVVFHHIPAPFVFTIYKYSCECLIVPKDFWRIATLL